jgi:hypothetical protein
MLKTWHNRFGVVFLLFVPALSDASDDVICQAERWVDRLYFNVRRVAGQWEVHPDNEEADGIPAQFLSEAEAVKFAMHWAKAVSRGTRSGTWVRLFVADSVGLEVLRCGEGRSSG